MLPTVFGSAILEHQFGVRTQGRNPSSNPIDSSTQGVAMEQVRQRRFIMPSIGLGLGMAALLIPGMAQVFLGSRVPALAGLGLYFGGFTLGALSLALFVYPAREWYVMADRAARSFFSDVSATVRTNVVKPTNPKAPKAQHKPVVGSTEEKDPLRHGPRPGLFAGGAPDLKEGAASSHSGPGAASPPVTQKQKTPPQANKR